jgi:ATP-dependent Clp endopeptidase proteolytic subunit ClpP
MYEIEIFGSIVAEKTKPNQVTMSEIRSLLKEAEGEEVLMLINSGGGSVINGSAILDEIDRYPSTINAHIMGICGSMATQIASKCQSVSMNANALYMIHNPSGGVVGEAKDMDRQASLLRSMKITAMVNYMAKTGLSEEVVSDMMDKTTYMTAEEALKLGFIDEITDAVEMTAEFKEYILEADDVSEQAKAYFKQTKTETSMSEEQKEKGILDKIVSLIKGNEQEPVQETKAEAPSVDFEMKFNELDVEMKAQLEAKSVELDEIKASHEEAIAKLEADHKAELEEVVAKVEVVAKAFEDGKLSVVEAKEELKSEAKSDEVEAKLEDVEDKFSADIEKDEISKEEGSEYATWMAMDDAKARQEYYKEHQMKIDTQYELQK